MKTTQLFLCLCLIIGNSHLAKATTYYLDSEDGSNQNDGLSPTTAWQNAIMTALVPGDSVLYKRGGEWNRRWYFSVPATASQPIYLGAYGDPSSPLPIISGILPIAGADDPNNWTANGADIWALHLNRTPGRLFLDGEEYLTADALPEIGIPDSENVQGSWYWDINDSTLYVQATQNPALAYSSIEGSWDYAIFDFFTAHYYEIENLDIRGGSGAAIRMFATRDAEISHCKLGNASASGILLTYANVDGTNQSCERISIHDNTFDSKFTFHYGTVPSNDTYRGCDDGIRIAHGGDYCIIYRNVFKNWGHNAVELKGEFSTTTGANYNLIYDNYITAPDIPYAHPFGADGILGHCQFNEFYRNRAEHCRTASQINGNDNWVHHNIIAYIRDSPAKNTPTAYAFLISVYGNTLVCQNNRYEHNTIVDADEAAFFIRTYNIPNQISGNIIQNNIIYNTGQSPLNNAYEIGTGLVIDDANNGVDGNSYFNNLFYSAAPNAKAVYAYGNYYAAPDFSSLDGVDGDVIQQNQDGDPLFTNLSIGDYTLLVSSPAINQGRNGLLLTDYLLNDRIIEDTTDIGAIETPPNCFTDLQLDNVPLLNTTYEAQNSITSRAYLPPQAISTFKAANSIVLKDGFSAAQGSSLHAKIENCGAPNLRISKEDANSTALNPLLTKSQLQLYPNPIAPTSELTVRYDLPEVGAIQLQLLDIHGRVLKTVNKINESTGIQELTIPMRSLLPGIYYLRIYGQAVHLGQLFIVGQ